jgi:DNA-binding MarR family transcriptional regulator
MKDNNYELADIFWELIQRVSILSNNNFKSFSLGYAQYSSLLIIAAEEGLSIQRLSELLIVDKTTASKTVQKLEKKGFVIKERSLNDGRGFSIFLSKKGKSIIPSLNKSYEGFVEKIFFQLTKKEREQFFQISKKIISNII